MASFSNSYLAEIDSWQYPLPPIPSCCKKGGSFEDQVSYTSYWLIYSKQMMWSLELHFVYSHVVDFLY